MQKDRFREWLEPQRTKRAASDCISRCKKVELALNVDLDEEYKRDKGRYVLLALSYGKKEKDTGVMASDKFHFQEGCNVVQRFTDLRASVKKYFAFCENQ